MNENRGNLYLLTGLLLGLVLGLAYAWVVQPVEYVDTSPASLRQDFKDKYRILVASAYVANGDLVRAQARLELLGDDDIYQVLAEQAQRTLAEQGSADEARALGLLAIALGQDTPGAVAANTQVERTPTPQDTSTATATITPTPIPTDTPTVTPQPTATPTETLTPEPTTPETQTTPQTAPEVSETPDADGTPTETPIPRPTDTPTLTFTPSLTPGGPFVLVDREKDCSVKLEQPRIQIQALNGLEQPVPGVLVIVTWEDGEERFFTGLKPELGLGYADFTPLPGVAYTLRLEEGGESVADLLGVECEASGGELFWGTLWLQFTQQ